MIYIFTAIYAEAKNIISHYELKKQCVDGLKFDVFTNEDIRLLITGTGQTNAAVAVGNAGGVFNIGKNDTVINIGSCAMRGEKAGNVYIINKIKEEASGRTFYPDMLIRTNLRECMAVTVVKPFKADNTRKKNEVIQEKTAYEMEAASIYQSASFFVGPDRISFIKIVSDGGEPVSKEEMQNAIDKAAGTIYEYIDLYVEILHDKAAECKEDQGYKADIDSLAEAMCCSKVMKDQLFWIIKYCYLGGIDYKKIKREFYDRKMLPCSSKKEGKICLEEFKNRLL